MKKKKEDIAQRALRTQRKNRLMTKKIPNTHIKWVHMHFNFFDVCQKNSQCFDPCASYDFPAKQI